MDYYKILGVARNASKEEIKRAYRKLAHKYHPDKKGGDEQRFKEINEAYHVLADETKRTQYDQFGKTFDQGQGFDFSQFSEQNGAQGFDFSDIFEDFFGFSGQGKQDRRQRRGRDISIDVELSLAESVFGTERRVLLTKIGLCDACHGEGGNTTTGHETCKSCDGSGTIRESRRSLFGNFAHLKECDRCSGRGRVWQNPCTHCNGKGVGRKTEEVPINVPAGIREGEMIRFAGMGEASAGGIGGDLYVKVHVRKHLSIKREGNDLITTLEIPISEALLGAEHMLQTLDGSIKIKVPPSIAPGEFLRVRGKGVPISQSGRRGDFLIRVSFKMPKKISRNAKSLIEELKKEGI